jgi:hypothetical protein
VRASTVSVRMRREPKVVHPVTTILPALPLALAFLRAVAVVVVSPDGSVTWGGRTTPYARCTRKTRARQKRSSSAKNCRKRWRNLRVFTSPPPLLL